MTVTRLRRFLQAFAKKRPNFQIFYSSGSTHLWKIAYLGVAALLFGSAAQNRFSLPQDPLVDTDFGRMLARGKVSLFIFDADGNVRRDLVCYGDLPADRCWLVIDDYFGACVKAAPREAQVNELVSAGRLVPFGFYGWSTWVGQWRPK